MVYTDKKITLLKKDGKYIMRLDNEQDGIPVKIVCARPLSENSKDIAFLNDKKQQVAMIESLESLDSDSRAVAKEALALRYFMARVSRVIKTQTHFGTRFWEVETDKGVRKFALRDPNRNVLFQNDGDRILVRDTLGNYYEIESMAKLDAKSVAEVEKVT